MLNHSTDSIPLVIDGKEYRFGLLRLGDVLRTVEWANERERAKALEQLNPQTMTERIEVFRATRGTYGIDRMGELLEDPEIIVELLWQAFTRPNPDVTREEFVTLFSCIELTSLETMVDALYGGDASTDPTQAAAESEASLKVTAKSSPPSAEPTATE
jgi:hypothetical protein